MIRKHVHYRVDEGQVALAHQIIAEFVAAIRENEPETGYSAYQTSDPHRFIHTMTFPDAAAEKAHQTAPYTLKFVERLYPNCAEPPVFTDLHLVAET